MKTKVESDSNMCVLHIGTCSLFVDQDGSLAEKKAS